MRRLPIFLAAIGLVPLGTAVAFALSERRHHESVPPASSGTRHFDRRFDVSAFLKGNLHTHTNHSDGDSSPEEVALWYRKHGYAFLALTDHNRLTDTKRLAWLQDDTFRLIPGEEITMRGNGRQVHVNALCVNQRISGGTFVSAAEALAWATRQTLLQGGVAVVNHPNFDRALAASDLPAADGAALLEIMSGHPYVYWRGTSTRPSEEALWDTALTSGQRFMGVAVDDMHHLRVTADPPAYAGRGWVQIFATHNDPGTVCDALRRGALYSSDGVSLRRIRITRNTYSVWPATSNVVVSFIGAHGKILSRSANVAAGEPATYALEGDESYVRARVTAPDGTQAWTPAVFVAPELPTAVANL